MNPKKPVYRKLRVFAFDPGATAKLNQTMSNEVTLAIPWEELERGPAGEYVAVVDEDEKGNQVNDPVDLDDPFVLAGNGLTPSDGNPQFHQQMLYAVAMRTIAAFEKALGRKAHWATIGDAYTPQLKLFPHHQQIANAYFSQETGSCHFGYFPASTQSQFPGMMVYSCLSQDVIAHQVAHALLSGMHSYFIEETNPHVFAFHEAFCDLVALLQHFSLPEIVRHQIALNGGELSGKDSLLGVLAYQFGEALGIKAGLRSYLGTTDENGVWQPVNPDPRQYQRLMKTEPEPHALGAILGGAVFNALNRVYRSRVADLKRISSEGTGILKEGELHPDLVNRMAREASRTAQVVLQMCVRALDYCPAVDITFSDFLRAIITADLDLFPDDPMCYRAAFADAFRRYGIFPADIGNLSIDALLWPKPSSKAEEEVVKPFVLEQLAVELTPWNLPQDREKLYTLMREKADSLQEYLLANKTKLKSLLGEIDLRQPFNVKSIWPRQHSGPYNETFSQWVIVITQTGKEREERKAGELGEEVIKTHDLACCTLLVDAETGLVRYSIHKASGSRKKRKPELKATSPVAAPKPRERKLRVYAFDPSLSVQLETAPINQVTLGTPWEELRRLKDGEILDPREDSLSEAERKMLERLPSVPIGEYLEVVDYDAPSDCFYEPVDLHHPYVLAEDGLAPSQSVPQFHQQMVYAVAMRTIRNFESILGRNALWASRWATYQENGKEKLKEEYVPRLRLYPHALREANAFYSPEKKALLFGYFQTQYHPQAAPVTVFTSLSQDIIAHEMTHALLDGTHRRLVEASNPDMLAFHEAFADLVALFQHFSLPEVLEHQIANTRGDLTSQSRLGELAQEFGAAIGNHGALRSAIGQVDPQTGEWKLLEPDPQAYQTEMEPHNRGALLVATVFDAFLKLYRTRVADLLRIATHGSGVLPAGNIHPDLVRRLAAEAARCAKTVLEMCVHALDYLPPVDITFGDYLRAIVTANYELDPVDEEHHRVAFIEAFWRHGILPEDMRTYSEEGLLWEQAQADTGEEKEIVIGEIKNWSQKLNSWNISRNRKELFYMMRTMRWKLHEDIKTHLLGQADLLSPERFPFDPKYLFEVHALRPSQRVDWQGQAHFQWIITITQQIPEFLDQARAAQPGAFPDYAFRGGATLLVDAETGRVRYAIKKRLDDDARRQRQRKFISEVMNQSLYATYFQDASKSEPFAILHRF